MKSFTTREFSQQGSVRLGSLESVAESSFRVDFHSTLRRRRRDLHSCVLDEDALGYVSVAPAEFTN